MKTFLSLLLTCILLLCPAAVAEDATQALVESGLVGVWIENDGYGTLTLRMDGTSEMIYYDDTVTECHWEVTDDGARFTDGQWLNSPMELLDENTLSVASGWMVFTREGFLPATDPALLLNAVPVGEEGDPFLGQWTLSSLILEGEEIDPALFDMAMTLTFNADGTAVTDDGWEAYTTTWFVSYGNAVVEGDILSIDENDQLILNARDGAMVFTRVPEEIDPPAVDDPIPMDEPAAVEDPVPVGEEGAPFLGQWTLASIEMDGMSMNPALLGMTMTLTLTEDGLATLADDLDVQTTTWTVVDGAAIVEDSPLTLTEDGKLVMTDEDGAAMIFTQGEAAASDESDADDLLALMELFALMEEVSSDVPAFDHLDTKFVCTQFSSSGTTLDAAMLGAEYAVYFRESGTADLTLAGYTIENLPYTIDENGAYVINYYGAFFSCVPTETGFDVDYYGTMTLHCTPAE